MSTYQKVIIVGNLGDEVKMHYFEGGGCIARFPIATSETWKDREGQKQTSTEWHNIVVRNKQAETCEKYLSKGDKILIEGKIKTRKWQDDSGNDRYSTEIHAFSFNFMTTKSEKEQRGSTTEQQPATDQSRNVGTYSETGDNDDLPF